LREKDLVKCFYTTLDGVGDQIIDPKLDMKYKEKISVLCSWIAFVVSAFFVALLSCNV
jgi:hypothetical protein